ncbi:MAG: hypothetical protein HY692_09710 [Cyanobacteria bacterium NC_groundwater_1444_Ag_S-0.65um_54_12]|nr:hypothetical protein [Cyanobacteria bacterium NC_groundwater_1444_Ag_S-0.65um_54_12]
MKRMTWLVGFIVAGCTVAPVANNVKNLSVNAALDTANAVVASAGQQGNRTVSVNILPAREMGFRTQAIVHKWVDNDIFEYRVKLKYFSGGSYVDFVPPLMVTVPRKGGTPKTKAVFTNLKQGMSYQVSMLGFGNVGGSAASTQLNNAASTAIFDFTASQDVEDTQSASLQVVFDAVNFSGSGAANVATPADGTFQNPTVPEIGEAQ